MFEPSGNVVQLFSELKTEIEKKEFIKAQYRTVTTLLEKNKKLEEEVVHLKMLLINNHKLLESFQVQKVIVTPEQALIDSQIEMIQSRNLSTEMNLEDVKKFDILIKAKKLLKEEAGKTFKGDSKKIDVSPAELLAIIKSPNDGS